MPEISVNLKLRGMPNKYKLVRKSVTYPYIRTIKYIEIVLSWIVEK